MQRQAPHRVGGVELLGDGDEGDAAGIERLDDPGEVRERAGQAIHLVDDDQIDLPLPDVGQQILQGGAVHGPAGDPAVVVAFPLDDPALAALGLDVGLARLALGVEAVEILLQPLLRGLPGVDGATNALAHSPKNLGPDQRAPVMTWAILESDR